MKKKGEEILKAHGYVYNFDRMAYYNRSVRKAFSFEWIQDHSEDDLSRALREENDGEHWRIYADRTPSQAVIDAFLAEVNG